MSKTDLLKAATTLKDLIVTTLDDNKAENIEVLDLKENDYIADFMVIASGRSSRQVVALADKLIEKINAEGIESVRKEGFQTGDWVVLDAGDVIVHLFKPEVREFYNIEKMWGDFAQMSASSQQTVTP